MSISSISILAPHFAEICEILFPGDGAEHAAYILFGEAVIKSDPWTRETHNKYVSHQVIQIPQSEVISNDARHITWKMDSLVHALRLANQKRMVLGVIHSHPAGYEGFSEQDDKNERDWIKLAQNRNGPDTKIISLVLTPNGAIKGRIWINTEQAVNADMIRIFGDRFKLDYPGRGEGSTPNAFNRQALALGNAFSEDLSKLRIGIVGLGGTGSALNLVLGRMGPGYVALFDKDRVDETNRSRLHGSTKDDVHHKRLKVDIAERVINEMGLGTQVAKFPHWIDDPRCHDAQKSCDVIIGCTDDNDGRVLLNQIPYYYGIPVIDIGLALEVSKTPPYRMLACDGRVTVILPGNACLLCRNVINVGLAREESLERALPDEFAKLKDEAYVQGEGNPSPAVVFFTTELATMAIQELVHRLQGYRGEDGSNDHVVRKFHLQTDRKPMGKSHAYCPTCGKSTSWGRADDTRFLGLIGKDDDDV